MILVMQNTAETEKRLEQQRGGKLLRGLGKSGIRSRDTVTQVCRARMRRARSGAPPGPRQEGAGSTWEISGETKKVGCRDSMGLFSREDRTGAAVWLGESGCRAKDKLGVTT